MEYGEIRRGFSMTTLTIELPDESLKKLKDRAEAAGLEVEEFVQKNLEDWLESAEDKFDSASRYVIKKNAELYRRLAG
jgi:hypothetical protein